jgi:hypothetical protein
VVICSARSSVRRIANHPVLGEQRHPVGEQQVADAACHHRHGGCDEHLARPQRQRGIDDLRIAVEAGARKPAQLVTIGCRDIGKRQQFVANGFGDRNGHIKTT